jgi:hypothetical protein
VTRGQAPYLVAFGVAEQADRGERGGELGGAGEGERPSRRKASRAWGVSPRLNGCRQVISSLPVQPVRRAASSGSRTVHRPESCDRLSSKLSSHCPVRSGRRPSDGVRSFSRGGPRA